MQQNSSVVELSFRCRRPLVFSCIALKVIAGSILESFRMNSSVKILSLSNKCQSYDGKDAATTTIFIFTHFSTISVTFKKKKITAVQRDKKC